MTASTPGPLSVNAVSSSGSLSLFCRRLGRPFLVDSGADVSVFPASPAARSRRATGSLHAANGSVIKTFGTCALKLDFGRFLVNHSFTLAEVSKPILGSDFFIKHKLVIDLSGQCVTRSHPRLRLRARRAQVLHALFGLRLQPPSWPCLLYTSPSPRDS